MAIFVQFPHATQGYVYVDPRDIVLIRSRDEPDVAASATIVLRSGQSETISGLSVQQIARLMDILPTMKARNGVVPLENLFTYLAEHSA